MTCLALTCLFFTSTLFPQRTMGIFSHTLQFNEEIRGCPDNAKSLNIYKQMSKHLQRSRCHVGTFLYVNLAVTSNIMIAHCPWMLQSWTKNTTLKISTIAGRNLIQKSIMEKRNHLSLQHNKSKKAWSSSKNRNQDKWMYQIKRTLKIQ